MPTNHPWKTENENTGKAESEDENRPARPRKEIKENWERQGGPQLPETRGKDVTGWEATPNKETRDRKEEKKKNEEKRRKINQSCADSDDKHMFRSPFQDRARYPYEGCMTCAARS